MILLALPGVCCCVDIFPLLLFRSVVSRVHRVLIVWLVLCRAWMSGQKPARLLLLQSSEPRQLSGMGERRRLCDHLL